MSEQPETRTASTVVDKPAGRSDETSPTVGGTSLHPVTYEQGAQIGRYVVLGPLGQGGMGTVLRAYDPELDRQIALKIVRLKRRGSRARDRARDRLLREAQALGKLSHPNVVAAYDVGVAGEGVFVAMELVEGRTFKTWLREESPDAAEIVRVLVGAGRGVAAAHAAGIVHRDFKPDNILVGDDGRVRVADFGLARAARPEQFDSQEDTPSDEAVPGEHSSGEHRLSAPLTQFGTVIGTPSYMAAEQYLGEEVDEYTDQFSFCVTLFEALYGSKPFPQDNIEKQRDAVVDGTIADVQAEARVPARLRKIVLRGLSRHKQDRFESMDALLSELSFDPALRRRRVVVAGAMVLLGATTVVALASRGGTRRAEACGGARDRLDEVWNDEVRAAIEHAFIATKRPYARSIAQRIRRRLDARAVEWVQLRTDVCRATRVRRDQSEELMDRRIECLDRRLAEMVALTTLFAKQANARVVDKAVQATYALTGLATCMAIDRFTTTARLPPDPAERARIEALSSRLDRVKALHDAGRYRDAVPIADKVVDATNQETYGPLRARALFWSGWLLARAGKSEQGRALLDQAALVAANARDDVMLARIASRSLYVLAIQQQRAAETLAGAQLVLALVARAGDDVILHADVLRSRGYAEFKLGRYDRAMVSLKQAASMLERKLGADHPELGHTYNLMGNVLVDQKRYAEAAAVVSRAMQLWKHSYGAEHPSVAVAHNNLGHIAFSRKHFAEAEKHWRTAMAIQRKVFGASHPKIAIAMMNLAELAGERGQNVRAREGYAKAFEIIDAKLPPNHPFRGYALTGLGRYLLADGHVDRAVEVLERALAVRERGERNKKLVAKTCFLLAKALWRAHKRKRALALARRAEPVFAAGGKSTKDELADVRTWLKSRQ